MSTRYAARRCVGATLLRSGCSFRAIICELALRRGIVTEQTALAALEMERNMGRGILLWLLGVPIPIIIILALIWH